MVFYSPEFTINLVHRDPFCVCMCAHCKYLFSFGFAEHGTFLILLSHFLSFDTFFCCCCCVDSFLCYVCVFCTCICSPELAQRKCRYRFFFFFSMLPGEKTAKGKRVANDMFNVIPYRIHYICSWFIFLKI